MSGEQIFKNNVAVGMTPYAEPKQPVGRISSFTGQRITKRDEFVLRLARERVVELRM